MTASKFALDWNAGATAVIDLEAIEVDRYRLGFTSPYRSTMRLASSELSASRHDFDDVPKEINELAAAGGFLARGGGGTKERPNDTLERLANAGRMLLQLALPPYAVNELHGSSLFIELGTDETLHDLPWELLHDGEEFLALKHHLGRFLIQRQTQSGTFAAHELQDHIGALRALVICVARPEDRDGVSMPLLEAAEQERNDVVEALDDAGVQVDLLVGPEARKREVLRALREPHHIIHFTGHAIASREDPRQSSLVLHDANLTVSTLTATLAYQRALLCFINGCETAPAMPPPDAAGSAWDAQFALFGLARAFLECGAYVLGTRWRLPDLSGLGFARHFYRMLLNERAPFGRAISEARRTLLAEDPEDISWASYIYWGDPRVYFRRARTTSVVLPPGAVRAMPATGEVTAADARALALLADADENARSSRTGAFARLADAYENARTSTPSGSEQTVELTRIVNEAATLSRNPAPADTLDILLDRDDEGGRVVALAVLEAFPDPSRLDLLLDIVSESRSALEQYHALLAIKLLGPDVPASKRDAVADVLHDQFTREGFLGTDRFIVAQQILAGLGINEI
jgi:CHAT domain-containing protein